MSIHTTNAQWLAEEAMAEALEPPPPIDYLAWAESNIVFTARETSHPGPYNRDLFPEFDEILTALSPEDPCRVVTLAKGAQLGGTVVANIFTLGSMGMDPGDFLYVHPTEENARRWSKMKLRPMLRNTTSLTRLFPERSRDVADSVLYKERADGRGAIQISGANSPSSLSMVSMRRQIQDDLAKYEMNAGGDPETQADSRSASYEFAKIFKLSTPLVWPGCRITKSYRAGSQEQLYLPCPDPDCGHMQVLEWANMLANLDEAKPEDAHFTCVACGGEIREHQRAAMKAAGEWRAANPKAKPFHRSFHLWGAYSILMSFERIARRWLEAKGDPASEQTFMNDVAGLAFEAQGEAVPWETLRDRAHDTGAPRGFVPAGALLTTIGIDCQIDRVEWQRVGWGRFGRRWVIDYGVIPEHIREPGCREKLDGLIAQTLVNCVGRRLPADLAAIDGNAWTEEVWDWVRRHPPHRVMMVRGVGSESAPLLVRVKREVSRRTGKKVPWSRRFYNFATSVLKMSLYANLAKGDPIQPGYVALPKGLEDEYFRQLTAERRRGKKNRQGHTVYEWVKDPVQANEGLDTHLQAEAAAIRLGVRGMPDSVWNRLEAERETPPPEQQLDLEDLPLIATAAEQAAVAPLEPQKPAAPPVGKPRAATLAELAARMNGRG